SDYAAIHLLANGQLDTSFGTNGWAQIDMGGEYEIAYGVAVQSDGKIVLAGETLDFDTGSDDFGVARLTSSGHLDSSFGSSGFVFTDFGGEFDQAASVSIQSDGKIVVSGVASVGGHSRFAIARYCSNGNLDSSFKGGMVTLAINSEASASAMAIDSQGRFVLAGFTYNNQGNYDFATARFIGKINVPPVAVPAGGYVVDSGGSIHLDGSASYDTDGMVASYAWDFNYDGTTFDTDATG